MLLARGGATSSPRQLEAEGYKPERRFQYLIVGTATREDADALAARLHGEVEAGGEVVAGGRTHVPATRSPSSAAWAARTTR